MDSVGARTWYWESCIKIHFFENLNNLDFTLSDNSPCIDSGDPSDSDPDNTIRDIGAVIFYSYELGDCSQDSNSKCT